MSNATFSLPARLSGRALLTGRLLYALIFLLSMGSFGVSLAFIFDWRTAPCDSSYHLDWAGCAEWIGAIEGVGLSAVSFESYFLFWRIAAALPFLLLSLWMIRRRGNEPRVLLFGALLLVLGAAGTWFNPLWIWAESWFQDYSSFPILAVGTRLLTFLLFSGLFLFAILFPDGRFIKPWMRWPAGVFLLLAAGYAFFPDTALSWANWPNPELTSIPVTLIFAGIAIGSVVVRLRNREAAGERRQVKWLVAGFLLMTFNFLIDYSVWSIYPNLTGEALIATAGQAVRWELAQDSLWYLSQILFAAFIGRAIFRHGLWDLS